MRSVLSDIVGVMCSNPSKLLQNVESIVYWALFQLRLPLSFLTPPRSRKSMSVKKRFAAVRRVLWVFIPAVLVLVLGVGGLDFYLIHRLTHPQRQTLYNSPRDLQVILQPPMWFDESWKNLDATQSVGWLLSRGTSAPAVILSHGYGGNRSDMLTLGVELWKGGYHVLLYDLRGHGDSTVKWH